MSDEANTERTSLPDQSVNAHAQEMPFERTSPMIGAFIGFLVLTAGMSGAFLYWDTITKYNLANTGVLIFAAIGAMLLLAIFYAGTRIIISAIRTDVIPERDRQLLEPLISSANDRAIEQYVRLSSLTGMTGTATKLGLTGLPLLTVALTLIFSALEIYTPQGGFLDLAKLTLGAFIGSFVQRTATAQAVTEAVASSRRTN